MLIKFTLLIMLSLLSLPATSKEKSIKFITGGINYHVTIERNNSSGTLYLYQDEKLILKNNNLIINQPSLYSYVSPMASGGIALSLDSDGSRSKYHVVIPLHIKNEKISIKCIYKTIYDSVESKNFAGSTCTHQPLHRLDLESIVNEENMYEYKSTSDKNRTLSSDHCRNPSSFTYGKYQVTRCQPSKNTSGNINNIIISNKSNGNTILDISGYDFIPKNDDDQFSLITENHDKIIKIDSSLSCLSMKASEESKKYSAAKIDKKYSIRYQFYKQHNCYLGNYFYLKSKKNIGLSGVKYGDTTYLIERDKNNRSSGTFILKGAVYKIDGIWVSSPPNKVFSVESD